MKRLPIIVVVLVLSACSKTSPSTNPAPVESGLELNPMRIRWEDRSIFSAGLISSEQDVLEDSEDVTTYHMDLELSADMLNIFGRMEVRYTNLETEPLSEIYFRLFPNITGGGAVVSSLEVDGEQVEPLQEFQYSAIRVPLTTDLVPGESTIISMNFGIKLPTVMGGNYGLFGYFQDVVVLNEFFPVIPVFDDDGWNVEIPHPNGDFPNYDISYYIVRVRASDELTIVSTGIELGRVENDGMQQITFVAGPVRNYYFAASTELDFVSESIGETTVNSYAFKDRLDGARLAAGFAINALKSFGDRLGTYPYTEFDIVSTPMQALGMEYPGLTAIALEIYNADRTFQGTPSNVLLESVVAHEVGHQWFFNAIGNDQIDEPWLDESITQYVTGLYYLDTYGAEAYQNYRQTWVERWDRADQAPIPIGMPAGRYSGLGYGAIIYGRGPLFIEALAERMGQDVFDKFLRDYYVAFKWGRSTSAAFHAFAEESCACPLDGLFAEWVYE
ncbi:MAG: M1 family metallopeptidase [Chloroflexi bacterium]|nr:M1 family metallopeptidase [Chloroflexota bacterium]